MVFKTIDRDTQFLFPPSVQDWLSEDHLISEQNGWDNDCRGQKDFHFRQRVQGRQILYFLDPVFSASAKIMTPGVASGWSRGLSDSLYFPMPLTDDGDGPPPAQALSLPNPAGQEEGDFDEEYQKLLAA